MSYGSNGKINTSSDGIDWQIQEKFTGQGLGGVAWNGNRYVLLGNDPFVFVSDDGITWQQRQVPTKKSINKDMIISSPDGKRWTVRRTGIIQLASSMATGSTQLVIGNNRGIWYHQGPLPDKTFPPYNPIGETPPNPNNGPENQLPVITEETGSNDSGGGSFGLLFIIALILRLNRCLV